MSYYLLKIKKAKKNFDGE